jgi:hypothetical protein
MLHCRSDLYNRLGGCMCGAAIRYYWVATFLDVSSPNSAAPHDAAFFLLIRLLIR